MGQRAWTKIRLTSDKNQSNDFKQFETTKTTFHIYKMALLVIISPVWI